jgi:hypothetical protein
VPQLGGVYNAAAVFPALSTVTIVLYHPVSGDVISLVNNTCPEIASGLYIWNSSKLTSQPTGYQEYAWRMTDGFTFAGGIIRMNALNVDDIFNNVMEDGETFAQQIRLIRAEAAGSIVKTGNLHEIKSADGSKTRITANPATSSGRTVTATDGT